MSCYSGTIGPRILNSVFAVAVLGGLAGSGGMRAANPPQQEITVAAAANLMDVGQAIGSAFEAQTKIHPIFSFASTAQLTSQIENSAPFDVFLAADALHVDKLAREHLLVPGSEAVYATGALALWVPPGSKARITKLADLTASDVRVIALANPKLAPYGQAAVETLQHLGLWDQVKNKIVYAANISMAREFGSSKNADAVFTAYSLVLKEAGKVIPIDGRLHAPIVQKLGIVARSHQLKDARAFTRFVLGPSGRAILARYGYKIH
ncbi:MAG TPA: molybdate ABC transporter substrate-binding protein [Bryobacteraceae bacterium]|nr:molybdate ABC transporter substrate-binding protein [Bryobacteraceae bacterium]